MRVCAVDLLGTAGRIHVPERRTAGKKSFIYVVLKNYVPTSQKIARFYYKGQPVNSVYGNSRLLLYKYM